MNSISSFTKLLYHLIIYILRSYIKTSFNLRLMLMRSLPSSYLTAHCYIW